MKGSKVSPGESRLLMARVSADVNQSFPAAILQQSSILGNLIILMPQRKEETIESLKL